jgi:glycerol-3-phosphate dehydrogenase (NAD(P)+)
MIMKRTITVLGGGSWGTAVSKLLTENNHDVTIWIRDYDRASIIDKERENKKYLPGILLPNELKISSNVEESIADSDMIVVAVPTQQVRSVLEAFKHRIDKKTIIVNLSKGLEKNTLLRVSEICAGILPENSFVVLSGPSHAEEVALKMPTTVVAASEDDSCSKVVQDTFMNEYFRVYTNSDVIGVEIGGALKNVIALAAGISDGLGFGDNTKAALINRGIQEISRLAEKMGADKLTFLGLSGIGDLIVTCTSMHSRNRRAGILIGKGYTIDDAVKEIGMVVEGILTTHAAHELAEKLSVEMPIVEELYAVLYENEMAAHAVEKLMNREKKDETGKE